MSANLPMPKPPGVFSPWRKTSHFLLLIAALDLIALAVIAILAPNDTLCDRNILRACESVTVVTPSRVLALMNLNIGLIALYAGLISFLHKRPAAKLMALALLLFFISMFVAVRS